MVERKTKEEEVRRVPLSREFLEQRGFCCNSGCVNCPYKEKDMEQEKEKYEDMQAKAEGGLTAALAAASKARHQKPTPPDEPDVPEPVKVESPAPDEIVEDEAALRHELGVVREEIGEIREMITANGNVLKRIMTKISALNSKATKGWK